MDQLTVQRNDAFRPLAAAGRLVRIALVIAIALAVFAVVLPVLAVIAIAVLIVGGLIGLVIAIVHWADWAAGQDTSAVVDDDDGEGGGGEDLPASTVSNARPAPDATGGEVCAECRFYRAITEKAGQCRRFSPGFEDEAESASAEWPVVVAREWCGDFRQAASTPAGTVLH